ncbi:MAG: cyclic nucleotide-binding domain-containing protein [Anaerolineae bacterium]|nr:cyclic nucleotide-binding domain-containing protein [Anaerolineae bacterium]
MSSHVLSPKELEHFRNNLSPEDTIEAQNVALLRELASIDRHILAELITEETYAPGEFVFWEGASGDTMYLIWSGRVVVLKGALEDPTILGYRGPGEVIGEMALLEGQPRSASIAALEDLRLLKVERHNFRQLLGSDLMIGMNIMASLSARLRDSDNVRSVTAQVGKQLSRQVSDLEQQKQQLLELQQIREETADLIVHDLRNPLGSIQGVLSMFEMVLPPDILEENRQLLDIALGSSQKMQRLVDTLLDVAKLETGETQLSVKPIAIGELIQAVLDQQSVLLKAREINMRSIVAADLPAVVMDYEMMERVLANLTDNAMKYTPQDGMVTIAAEQIEHEVFISVTDTGSGIPEGERERIFERFAQVAGDRPVKGRRGFGLGLTFCRLAVEAHGGRIWVEAGPDDIGSRFVFTLPIDSEN